MNVKILRITTPIIAVFDVVSSDFVSRSRWNSKYRICFISEELQVNISTPSKKMELDFESISEDGSKTLPVSLENKNCVNLPILLHILQVRCLITFVYVSMPSS